MRTTQSSDSDSTRSFLENEIRRETTQALHAIANAFSTFIQRIADANQESERVAGVLNQRLGSAVSSLASAIDEALPKLTIADRMAPEPDEPLDVTVLRTKRALAIQDSEKWATDLYNSSHFEELTAWIAALYAEATAIEALSSKIHGLQSLLEDARWELRRMEDTSATVEENTKQEKLLATKRQELEERAKKIDQKENQKNEHTSRLMTLLENQPDKLEIGQDKIPHALLEANRLLYASLMRIFSTDRTVTIEVPNPRLYATRQRRLKVRIMQTFAMTLAAVGSVAWIKTKDWRSIQGVLSSPFVRNYFTQSQKDRIRRLKDALEIDRVVGEEIDAMDSIASSEDVNRIIRNYIPIQAAVRDEEVELRVYPEIAEEIRGKFGDSTDFYIDLAESQGESRVPAASGLGTISSGPSVPLRISARLFCGGVRGRIRMDIPVTKNIIATQMTTFFSLEPLAESLAKKGFCKR